MAGKQAKILSDAQINDLLLYSSVTRHAARNRVLVLLSAKAGLRAGEIAKLTWDMIVDASGHAGTSIELHDRAAKRRHGRRIPMHPELRAALTEWREHCGSSRGPVIQSERGQAMTANSVVIWFARAYRAIGVDGCSSHSGRRTFITRAARAVGHAGGSLRDVQLLAGHRSIETTQAYIEGDTDAQRTLVSIL